MRVKANVSRSALMERMRALVPEAERQLAAAQLEGAKELASRIRSRAPKDTGAYANSIEDDKLANRKNGQVVGRGSKGKTTDPNATGVFAEYKWRFLEFGTEQRFHKDGKSVGAGPARPHVMPTYRAYKKQLRRKMANAVNKAVRKVRKG